jgi:hypothetical protein
MRHYSEDDLILYYYGDARRRVRIERHLEACPTCAAAYRDLAGTLAMMVAPEVPERSDQYGLEVWQRVRHQLPEPELSWWQIAGRMLGRDRLTLITATAALIVAAFVAGRFWRPSPQAPVTVTSMPAAGTTNQQEYRQRLLIDSVADHLDRSERVLADIMNASGPRDISAEQRWAGDLLSASRLYRQDATELGERSVAEVLDDVERTLIEIVHSPSQIDRAELDAIRQRIDAAALLFKVRVLGGELRDRENGSAASTTPRTATRKTS